MIEVLQNLESQAGRFSPVMLLAPGFAAVSVGLFIWLGGLGLRRYLLAVAGAIGGAIVGFFVVGRNITSSAASAIGATVIFTFFAIVFQRFFVAMLSLILAVFIALVVLVRLQAGGTPMAAATEGSGRVHVTLSVEESGALMKAYGVELGARAKKIISEMSNWNWVILLMVAVAAFGSAYSAWHVASALACATFGTMLIFSGMSLLLMYKGTAPINAIFRRPLFYGIVFSAMLVFGAVEQLVLCKHKDGKSKHPAKHISDPRVADQNWRTS